MAGLKLEGDLTQINERQLEFIKSFLEKRGFKNGKADVQAVGKTGDNYIANVKRISVSNGNGGTFRTVAKIAPQEQALRTDANTALLFRNEQYMYTKVFPKFTQLEKAAGIPPQDRFRYANCYGSLDEDPNEVILLEDLNESNFKMLNRRKPLSDDCIKSVLKNLARMHSLGLVLKHKEPQTYEEFSNGLFDMWSSMPEQGGFIDYFKKTADEVYMILDDDTHKKFLKKAISYIIDYRKFALPDKTSKYAVIQQGDAWVNNMMFKFDEENTLLESIMIDYQASKSGLPTTDILHFLLNCTDYEGRKRNFHDWVDYYHSELDNSLSDYGLKANFIYSRDRLDSDLKRYAKIEITLAILISTIMLINSEEAALVKESLTSSKNGTDSQVFTISKNPETVKLIKKRIEGLLDSGLELGLLSI